MLLQSCVSQNNLHTSLYSKRQTRAKHLKKVWPGLSFAKHILNKTQFVSYLESAFLSCLETGEMQAFASCVLPDNDK